MSAPDDFPNTIPELIDQLKAKHPRLIILIGEDHFSRQTKPYEKEVLKKADVGFFEQPQEYMAGRDHLTRAETLDVYKHIAAHDPMAPAVELMQTPPFAVMMDMSQKERDKYDLANNALHRMDADGVRPEGESEASKTYRNVQDIVIGRAMDRVDYSNQHMVGVMADYLDKHFSKDKPFCAVGVVGSTHLSWPRGLEELWHADMGELLKKRGYEVAMLHITPVEKPDPSFAEGTLLLAEVADDGKEFAFGVVDTPRARQAEAGRG